MSAIIIKDGKIYGNAHNDVLWAGFFSIANKNGSIVNFVYECLRESKTTMFVCLKKDGNITYHDIQVYDTIAKNNKKKLIVGTLAQSFLENISYLYLPLDDNIFSYGIDFIINEGSEISWSQRKSIAYWRGACSGQDCYDYFNSISSYYNSVRYRLVKELYNYEKGDAKLTNSWSHSKNIPNEYFGNQVCHREFYNYKIFLIVDGNVIASNHMWGFASGAVPFLISNADCWFMPYITPFVHYIPIKYDLSDLKEKIEWVINNDNEAEEISKNAVNIAKKIFSSEFQKNYVREKINEYI